MKESVYVAWNQPLGTKLSSRRMERTGFRHSAAAEIKAGRIVDELASHGIKAVVIYRVA